MADAQVIPLRPENGDRIPPNPDEPGWEEAVIDVLAFARRRLLGDYRFDPLTGLWHHRTGPVEPRMMSRVSSRRCSGLS